MRRIVMALAMVCAPAAAAADWVPLTSDDQITAALAGRVLIHDAYSAQRFEATGETLHVTDRAAAGLWEARDGRYCSNWPPSETWTCYDLALDGNRLRFSALGLAPSIATYAE